MNTKQMKDEYQQSLKRQYNIKKTIELICDFVSFFYEETKKTTKDWKMIDFQKRLAQEYDKTKREYTISEEVIKKREKQFTKKNNNG